MGFIKEPEGVDFVIKSKPLTDKDRKEISKFIAAYKAKYRKRRRELNLRTEISHTTSPNR